MNFSSTLAEIRKMHLEDRLRLVEAIWDEIASEQEGLSLTDAQKQELERRLADDEANPDDVVPWEVIRAEAQARAKR